MINQTGDVSYLQLRGVNFQSGCLAYQSLPAVSGTNYLFPDSADVSYIAGKGANFCRIIFCWEALQPTLGGSISNTYTTNLINTVNLALADNMYVMIEMHPFNSSFGVGYTYNNTAIGTSPVTNAQFANLFTRLAQQFTDPRVIFGLCNEPNGVSTSTWLSASQAAINAIRTAGNNNMIFVQPLNYGSVLGFFSNNYFDSSTAPSVAMLSLTDPSNNLVLSLHGYFDSSDGYSGQATDIVNSTFGSTMLAPIISWCETNNWRFHLSEFAADSTNSIAGAVLSDMYAFMGSNETVCIGGAWWSYTSVGFGPALFDLQPTTAYTVDAADMALFTPFVDGYLSYTDINYVVKNISGGPDGYVSIYEPLALGYLPALTGNVRLPNKGSITSRNVANTSDISLIFLDGFNNLTLGASSTPIIFPDLAGFGVGYVAVSNTGTLSWSAGSGSSFTAGGDLTGSSTSQTVHSIQGVVISGTPASGYVLEATSATAASWQSVSSGSFTAGGDLTGTSSSQNVISITGAMGAVNISSSGNIITWNKSTTAPGLTQAANTTNSATAANMTISAQSATGTSSTGGNLILSSGTGTSLSGNVEVTTGNINTTFVSAQGTASTQNKNGYTYSGYCTTTNGSTSVTVLTIPVPSGKSVCTQVQYIGRNTSTVGTFAATFFTGAKNVSGTLSLFSGAASRTVSTIYDTAESAAGISGTGCTSTVSGSNLLIQIAGCSGMTMDWTFVAEVIVS